MVLRYYYGLPPNNLTQLWNMDEHGPFMEIYLYNYLLKCTMFHSYDVEQHNNHRVRMYNILPQSGTYPALGEVAENK